MIDSQAPPGPAPLDVVNALKSWGWEPVDPAPFWVKRGTGVEPRPWPAAVLYESAQPSRVDVAAGLIRRGVHTSEFKLAAGTIVGAFGLAATALLQSADTLPPPWNMLAPIVLAPIAIQAASWYARVRAEAKTSADVQP